MRRALYIIATLAAVGLPLHAQDAGKASDAIRIGITYRPGTRPGLVMVPGPGLDSVRAIIGRDLDYTDRFQMVTIGKDSALLQAAIRREVQASRGEDGHDADAAYT